jgi:hypothetical protein
MPAEQSDSAMYALEEMLRLDSSGALAMLHHPLMGGDEINNDEVKEYNRHAISFNKHIDKLIENLIEKAFNSGITAGLQKSIDITENKGGKG